MINIKNIIKSFAYELGFSEIGFASAEPLVKEYEIYNEWLENKYNASMGYLENNLDKRHDIRQVLIDAETVIVLGYNYNSNYKHNIHEDKFKGKISRYAWGDDYHDIILPKIKQLALKIKEYLPEAETKSYIDTGPILEKAWAARAGIGWMGKHSLIISKKFGSWMFLGIIITSAKLEADKPMRDFCGSCKKCISACPTGAIVESKIVDSNRCISFWTIESKGATVFPPDINKNLSGWVFGCDICQDVCPWNNRFQQFTDEKAFIPRNNETDLELDEIEKLTKDEFVIKFRNSPLKRPKIDGLKRNANEVRKWKNNQ